jgi:fatty-acyl-CoA synthase
VEESYSHAADLLTGRARLTPDREALFEQNTGRRCTYAQLNARACCLANFLREQLGVEKGDRVSILAHNSLVYLDLLYGSAKIGAIFAPLNWRLTAHELTYIVNDCKPKVILCGPEFSNLLHELIAKLEGDSYQPHILALDETELPRSIPYDRVISTSPSTEPLRPSLNGEDPYCILYTSGTTGNPKGAVLPHRQVLWNCINTIISWGLTEKDVSPVFTPLFHAGGLFAFLTPILYAGGRIILTRDFDPEESLRIIESEKCTVILGVPTLFQMWLDSSFFRDVDFRSVRFFISGGAPCPTGLMDTWRQQKGVIFRQGYGLTEVGTNCFSMTDEESGPKTGSVGKPIFHSKMRLVDPETEKSVAPGETGELLISGPHVCSGYWKNQPATSEALRDGWFYTGDMARMDEDGFYYIAGRYKDMIKSGGENIYAAEVETVFRLHPYVADAALIGLPDQKWGEVGLMIVVLHEDKTATEAELIEYCQEKLARYKIPKRVVFSNGLPYSPYGKVMKSELKKEYI